MNVNEWLSCEIRLLGCVEVLLEDKLCREHDMYHILFGSNVAAKRNPKCTGRICGRDGRYLTDPRHKPRYVVYSQEG
jgi:hypothetical protein